MLKIHFDTPLKTVNLASLFIIKFLLLEYFLMIYYIRFNTNNS